MANTFSFVTIDILFIIFLTLCSFMFKTEAHGKKYNYVILIWHCV